MHHFKFSKSMAIIVMPVFLIACEQSIEPASVPMPVVSTAYVVSTAVANNLQFPATIEALKSVEILARVEGYLISRHFEEGSTVKSGDLLYEIDPKPYQAALQKSAGQLAETKAALHNAKQKLQRQKTLASKDFVSKQVLDNILAQVKEYEGQVISNQAAVETARLNLSYCSIYAPFTGRIGYTEINVGNLVNPEKNPRLVRLVQMDPIYATFSPSDHLLPQFSILQEKAPIPVSIFFNDNSSYAHQGKLDSIDNRIDSSTNTIRMRAVFANPDNLLVPGEYVKVRAFLGDQQNTLLIPQTALDEQQGGYRVFVVNGNDIVTAQTVTVGDVYQQMRIIKEGLKVGDEVVTSGLQKLKSGNKIQRESKPAMPDNTLPKAGTETNMTPENSTIVSQINNFPIELVKL